MARDGKNVKDLKMPRSLKKGLKEPSAIGNPLTKDGAPTLMGNIGPTKNKYLDPVSQMDLDHKQRRLFSKMAEEFDIDNVIPKAKQKQDIADGPEAEHSLGSFDLSLDYEVESRKASSRGNLAR